MINFMDQSTYDSLDRITKEYILIEILVDDATFPEDDDHILDASYLKFSDLSDSVQNAILSGAYDRFATATEFEHDPEDEPEWGEDWKEDDGEAYQFNDYDYIEDNDDESFDPDEYDYDEESYTSEGKSRNLCWRCEEGEHDYCLFDPEGSGNMCDCNVCGNTYKPNEYQLMQKMFGSDGGHEISDFQYRESYASEYMLDPDDDELYDGINLNDLDIFYVTESKWWDSLSSDQRSNYMNSYSKIHNKYPSDGTIYMDNYDEMDSSNQSYVRGLFRFFKDDINESYASDDKIKINHNKDNDTYDVHIEGFGGEFGLSLSELQEYISNPNSDYNRYLKKTDESYASEDSYPSPMIRKGQQYTKDDHYDYKDVGDDTFIVCDICGQEFGKLRSSTSDDYDDTIHRRLEDHVASVHGLVRSYWAESYVKKAKYTGNEGISLADWSKYQDEHGWYRVGVSNPTPEIEDIARSMGGNYYGMSSDGYGIEEWSFHNYSDAENFAQYVRGKSTTWDLGADWKENKYADSRYQPDEQHYVDGPQDISPYVFDGDKFTNIGSGAIGGHPLRNNPFGESYASEYKVGDYVRMTDDAIDNYGEQYRDKEFRISHVARSRDDHMGYDEGVGGNLYDFDELNFSLYDYELE